MRPVHGTLAMTYHMTTATPFILPQQSAEEAGLVNDAIVYPAKSLLVVCAHSNGHTLLTPFQSNATPQPIAYPDFNEVKGQSQAKRALEIAAAGVHSILISGPPGRGKSMLASRFVGILPAMTETEALESAAI